MNNKRIKNIIECGIFAAMISVLSLIAIPLPAGVPLTLQSFIVPLAGYFLGVKKGLASLFAYYAIGLVGVPVFSGFQGGVHVFLGPTGGFLLGFIFLAAFSGLGSKAKSKEKALLLGALGLVLCHSLGVLQFSFFSGQSLFSSFITSSFPFILKDAAFLFLSFVVSDKIKKELL